MEPLDRIIDVLIPQLIRATVLATQAVSRADKTRGTAVLACVSIAMESDCEIESISDDEDVEDGDDFKSAGSDLDSEPNSDGEQAITNELEEEDIIEEDFDDMVPLFPAAANPRTNVPVLQPEDANLSVVHLALKYAFGFPEFRGHQEACFQRLRCEPTVLEEVH